MSTHSLTKHVFVGLLSGQTWYRSLPLLCLLTCVARGNIAKPVCTLQKNISKLYFFCRYCMI